MSWKSASELNVCDITTFPRTETLGLQPFLYLICAYIASHFFLCVVDAAKCPRYSLYHPPIIHSTFKSKRLLQPVAVLSTAWHCTSCGRNFRASGAAGSFCKLIRALSFFFIPLSSCSTLYSSPRSQKRGHCTPIKLRKVPLDLRCSIINIYFRRLTVQILERFCDRKGNGDHLTD